MANVKRITSLCEQNTRFGSGFSDTPLKEERPSLIPILTKNKKLSFYIPEEKNLIQPPSCGKLIISLN